MFEATRQGNVFLTMMYAGLLCGALYDALRVIRRVLHAGRLLSAAIDLLFWTASAAVCVHAMVRTLHEPVRMYALLGAGCGMSLYLLGIGEVLYAAVGCGLRFAEHVQGMCKNGKKRSKKGERTKNFAEK